MVMFACHVSQDNHRMPHSQRHLLLDVLQLLRLVLRARSLLFQRCNLSVTSHVSRVTCHV